MVECSACHGEGRLHALNPTRGGVGKRPPEGTCRGCHTPERSPAFDYAAALEQIAHGGSPA